ncbi:MAG: hypothetical protein GXO88_10265 [Chlorobi bacterium]|nr:hypothetical protein [Chlorobiota bacterium]
MNSIINNPILERNQKCIINTDLDGILAALMLHNFLDWQIVGFCDSAENIWLDRYKCKTLKEAVFIDMFVATKKTRCIDQHIVAFDEKANNKILRNPNKLNPNLLNTRCFMPDSSYYTKYPFGTVHFIIALLENQGLDVELDLSKNVIGHIKLIDIFLRADDALLTSTFSNYVDNAEEWWKWLLDLSNKGKTTNSFCDYIEETRTSSTEKKTKALKNGIADLLISSPFYCSSPDGGYKGHDELGRNTLNQYVRTYIYFIAETACLKPFELELNLTLYTGKALRCRFSSDTINMIKADPGNFLFSYAFVRSSQRNNNFSYTLMPNSFKSLIE